MFWEREKKSQKRIMGKERKDKENEKEAKKGLRTHLVPSQMEER